jgi:hypothetical protein
MDLEWEYRVVFEMAKEFGAYSVRQVLSDGSGVLYGGDEPLSIIWTDQDDKGYYALDPRPEGVEQGRKFLLSVALAFSKPVVYAAALKDLSESPLRPPPPEPIDF